LVEPVCAERSLETEVGGSVSPLTVPEGHPSRADEVEEPADDA
jgi:hypothetical protein